MSAAAIPPDEASRLEALRAYDLLDTPPETEFDELLELAAGVSDAPMALLTLVDAHRQWFKARVGIDLDETTRDVSICAHTILEPERLVVPDARADARFADNPFVAGAPNIRFYAGVPLRTPAGAAIGAVCVMDTVPRQLTPTQQHALDLVGHQVMARLERRRETKALGKSEEMLRAIVESEPECVKLIGPDGALLGMNAAGLQMIEADSFEQVAGQQVGNLVAPEHRQAYDALVTRVFQGESGTAEFRITGLRGGMHWLETHAAPLRDASGAVTTLLGITRDISVQKRTDVLLREAVERFRLVARATSDAVWDWNLRTDTVWWNDYYRSAFGYDLGQTGLTTTSWITLLHPDDSARVQRSLSDALEGTTETWSDEYRYRRRDGTYAIVLNRAHILRDDAGHPIRMIGALQDITRRHEAEEEARALARRLKMATEAAAIGVWEWDVVTDEIYPSEEYRNLLGYAESGSIFDRTAWMHRVHPEDRDRARGMFDRAMAGGEGFRFSADLRMRHADGAYRWIRSVGRVLDIDAEGRTTRLLGVRLDVTDAKRAEAQARSLRRVYEVLNGIGRISGRLSSEPEFLADACRVAVEAGGFRGAWVGMLNDDVGRIEITAHAGLPRESLAALESMLPVPWENSGCLFTVEALRTGRHAVCNDIAKDPRAAPWRHLALAQGFASMVSLPLTCEGGSRGAFNLYAADPGVFDAEELKLLDRLALEIARTLDSQAGQAEKARAEEALHESNERFQELAANVPDAFWVTDARSLRTLYVSPAYEVIWGQNCESLYETPRGWLRAVHPEDAARVRQAVVALASGGAYEETFRILRPDESFRWVRLREQAVRSAEGDVVRFIGTAVDVTDQLMLEDQLRQSQRMEAVGRLAGGVAHDFNNVLTVIQGYGSVLGMPGISAGDIAQAAEEITLASERAAHLTRQLLAFSRRQVLQPRQVDLNAIVENLAKMLRRILGEDVELVLALHPSPLMLRADEGMLDQVLLNLVVNARAAMPDGGRLTIATAEEAPASGGGDRWLAVRVTDTGVGMPPEVADHIFEPFFTTKADGEGTGLGLATVFGIVTQHGGRIRVETGVGQGTTFHVTLPSLPPGEAEAVVDAAAEPWMPGGSETILVVEDETAVRVLTRGVLERAGYRVLEAACGSDALGVWREHATSIDVVITDVVMPGGVGGRELARRLRAERDSLPVVYVSGYSPEVAGRELALVDGENFLQKPFTPQRLLEMIRGSLDR